MNEIKKPSGPVRTIGGSALLLSLAIPLINGYLKKNGFDVVITEADINKLIENWHLVASALALAYGVVVSWIKTARHYIKKWRGRK